jgi:Protein of unknown function (DUF2934)
MIRQRTGEDDVSTSSLQAGGAAITPPRRAGTKRRQSKTGVKIAHEQIAQRAHAIWIQQGCRHGQDQQHWLEAERQLRAELAAKSRSYRVPR